MCGARGFKGYSSRFYPNKVNRSWDVISSRDGLSWTMTKLCEGFKEKTAIPVKTKSRFGECYSCFGCETKTGVVRIWLFFKMSLLYVQPYHSKGLGESFSLIWLNIGLSRKWPKYVLPSFYFHTQNRYSLPQNGGFVFTVVSILYLKTAGEVRSLI